MPDPAPSPSNQPAPDEQASPMDMDALMAALRPLDPAELARIEDDLDFYHFTGLPSARLKSLIAAATRPR